MKLMGLELGTYTALFDRVNVLHEFPGEYERDDKFPMVQARAAAQAMKPFLHGREVLLVGRGVANAFGHELQFLQWESEPHWGYRYAVIPHPSGRNHWYNSSENRERAETFVRVWVNNRVAFSPKTADNQST